MVDLLFKYDGRLVELKFVPAYLSQRFSNEEFVGDSSSVVVFARDLTGRQDKFKVLVSGTTLYVIGFVTMAGYKLVDHGEDERSEGERYLRSCLSLIRDINTACLYDIDALMVHCNRASSFASLFYLSIVSSELSV